jgi:hypothetical protein
MDQLQPNGDAFRAWAIVEIFGHERIAGEVSEQIVAGHGFVRVDVPALDGQAAFTRLYGQAAIYSITPVSEDIARRAAAGMRVRPVNVYLAALPAPVESDSRDDVENDELNNADGYGDLEDDDFDDDEDDDEF